MCLLVYLIGSAAPAFCPAQGVCNSRTTLLNAHADKSTCAQYSLWLDQHGMGEALAQIKGSLEACRPAASDKPGFEAAYPLMLQLCS